MRPLYHPIFKYVAITFIAALLFLSSCCEKIEPDPNIERTLLVYMAADNDLSRESYQNIEAMKLGFLPRNGNIIIYHDAADAPPRLIRLVKKDNVIEEELIEQYDEENSASPTVLKRSLLRVRELFPARDYALILWSHGNGWLPANVASEAPFARMAIPLLDIGFTLDVPKVKAFAQDGGRNMEIEGLVSAIPYFLSFILFDACLMGGVEVAYAMREKTEYLIASPAEILGDGFPYHQIMQPLFEPQPDLVEISNLFYRFYNEQNDERYRSATVALYRMDQFSELAATLNPIFSAHREVLNHFDPAQVQAYANAPYYFDLDHFIGQIATPEEYQLFQEALSKVVLFKRSTEYVLSLVGFRGYINIDHYSGLSTYIHSLTGYEVLKEAYKKSEWNRAVGLIE